MAANSPRINPTIARMIIIGRAATIRDTKLANRGGRESKIGPTLVLMSPALTTATSPDPAASAPMKRSFHMDTGFLTMTSSVIVWYSFYPLFIDCGVRHSLIFKRGSKIEMRIKKNCFQYVLIVPDARFLLNDSVHMIGMFQ